MRKADRDDCFDVDGALLREDLLLPCSSWGIFADHLCTVHSILRALTVSTLSSTPFARTDLAGTPEDRGVRRSDAARRLSE